MKTLRRAKKSGGDFSRGIFEQRDRASPLILDFLAGFKNLKIRVTLLE